jgi:hypothetical protein
MPKATPATVCAAGRNTISEPHPDDVFQERLYCIQWMTRETLGCHRPETFFAAVSEEDLARERKVEAFVAERGLSYGRE